MNELAENRISSTIAEIRGTCDIDKAIAMIKQLKGLQAALDSVGTFRDQSIKYAILHVEALVKVAELGGAGKLKGYEAKAALWLKEMPETERAHYIEMCKDGMLITQVWKREIGDPEKLKRGAETAQIIRECYVEQVLKNGEVDISQHADELKKCLPANLIPDFVDGTRNALLKAGAFGMGYNSGVYVTVTKDSEEKMEAVIKNRYRSARNDLAKINYIINQCLKNGMEVCVNENWLEGSPVGYLKGPEKIIAKHLAAAVMDLLEFQRQNTQRIPT